MQTSCCSRLPVAIFFSSSSWIWPRTARHKEAARERARHSRTGPAQSSHDNAMDSTQVGLAHGNSSQVSVDTIGLTRASGAMALSGSDLTTPAHSSLIHQAAAPRLGPPVKRRRLGRLIFTGLPKPAPRNAARDAVSPAFVANPDPTAGSSSRNAAPLQDVPPLSLACFSSSSQAKSSPEVHSLGNAADSIALSLLQSVTYGQP